MDIPYDHNPIEHFQKWFYEVDKIDSENETNAMFLSTMGLDGFPKSRIVLLKRFTWEGFMFFSNYNSEKGKAIANDNKVSLLFNWVNSKRQILILGRAEKLPRNMSEGYFESRPEGSKLSAWVSDQSEIINSRNVLEERLKKYEIQFQNKEIPKPDHWGGYIVKPFCLEFTKQNLRTGITCIVRYKIKVDHSWRKEIKYRKEV
ncbi:Pyridoxamine 5'-phosphate oxidase [Aquimarina amphilecti]|uniref:Pyridoxamine 5'-phosphate oxidase n=1 Tax=Aquimarina amphilecti TaxID=1038014 RepID=A0A1H7ME22_AQUAM|nr:pyridoxamine 5'-phosphate oxidase [Aquimarina amphilecti]SEL09556.1 Pyridoxamine 5'-phosphate oxidase [Aquimarina amphilecti]